MQNLYRERPVHRSLFVCAESRCRHHRHAGAQLFAGLFKMVVCGFVQSMTSGRQVR